MNRRYLSVALGALTVLLLGFVVAVASKSRPGNDGDDPLFEFDPRVDIDLGRIVGWVVVVLAVMGAILLVYGVKEAKPRQDGRKRNYLGILLFAIAFFLIIRFLQPWAADLLASPETSEIADDGNAAEGPSGGPVGWLFSILVAAVIAAALTRVGLTVRTAEAPFSPESPDEGVANGSELVANPGPVAITLGTDTRARVLNSYHLFEIESGRRGYPRRSTETASRHARRVQRALDLPRPAIVGLMNCYMGARYGSAKVTESEAEAAEAFLQGLFDGETS